MPDRRDQRLVLWPEDSLLTMEACRHLAASGMPLDTRGTLTDLLISLGEEGIQALLVDWDILQRQPPKDRDALAIALQSTAMRRAPLACLSRDAGMASRLAAVRYGARGYYCLPQDSERLLIHMERQGRTDTEQPGRVLIVDDCPSSGAYHARALNQAGLRAYHLSKPMQVLDNLRELAPDLILMDLYMPEASGEELVRVIRQQDAYLDIPIIYLSAESDMVRQRAAMALGGDEFLEKTIPPALLVSAVQARIQRYRGLRQLMVRDALTGLPNRAHFIDHLGIELARSQRNGEPLSVALMDIDHYQRVTDNHGQPTGDRVVRSLARLLKQRMRRTDLLGRYDNKAFAVAMPGTDQERAARVLNDLRDVFGSLPQSDGEQVFHSSFSAGLAQWGREEDRETLISHAGQALARAKQAGRNRVLALA